MGSRDNPRCTILTAHKYSACSGCQQAGERSPCDPNSWVDAVRSGLPPSPCLGAAPRKREGASSFTSPFATCRAFPSSPESESSPGSALSRAAGCFDLYCDSPSSEGNFSDGKEDLTLQNLPSNKQDKAFPELAGQVEIALSSPLGWHGAH